MITHYSGRLLSLAAPLIALLPVTTVYAQQPFDSSAFNISGAEWRVESYAGQSSLMLRNGAAWLKGSHFDNGTIEFDAAFSNSTAFPGIAFRAATHDDYELFYLRATRSGMWDATQYTPVLHGVYGWQIYTGPAYNAPVELAFERWMHIKLVVSGTRANVFVGSDTVSQVIPLLRGPGQAGEVGLVVGPGSAHFANLVVHSENAPRLSGVVPQVRDSTPATIIRSWRVSSPFPESSIAAATQLSNIPGGGTWSTLGIEERGIANLARLAGNGNGRNTVIAAVTLTTQRAETLRMRFGFSDRVRVFLNGRLVYAGNDSFAMRDRNFLGTVGLFDELALPLRSGANELWFAVSETFGGWAVTADLPDRSGVRVSP
ncbi:MAG TPA: hypothetical protein VM099_01275 [Gemmatimonadaceae bacterium]|nr:hypothetical protein [Gemmatimonadaceae bacterium]